MFLPLTLISMAASMRLTPSLIGRWGLRATLTAGLVTAGAGMAVLAVAMTAHGTLWALAPGLVIWGLGGGITFPAMFGAAAAGIPRTSRAPHPGSRTRPARSARPPPSL